MYTNLIQIQIEDRNDDIVQHHEERGEHCDHHLEQVTPAASCRCARQATRTEGFKVEEQQRSIPSRTPAVAIGIGSLLERLLKTTYRRDR